MKGIYTDDQIIIVLIGLRGPVAVITVYEPPTTEKNIVLYLISLVLYSMGFSVLKVA